MSAPRFNNTIGISFIEKRNCWRAYINEKYIGIFDTRIKALEASLRAEDIYQNILLNLQVDSVSFKRDNNNITLTATTDTGEVMLIDLGTLYPDASQNVSGDLL